MARKTLCSVLLAALLHVSCGDYSRELLVIPKASSPGAVKEGIDRFVSQQMEPRHAVAVVIAGKGTKRHQLIEELARDEVLQHLLGFGIQFAKGPSSLAVHRYAETTPAEYQGKWTRSALYSWLRDEAYPVVNRMQAQFAPPKYLTANPYGAVLVVKPLGHQSTELIEALRPHAVELGDRLKFTFFTKAPGTQSLCDMYGIWTNDEMLLLERPGKFRPTGLHSHTPPAPKFRLENVTVDRLNDFFAQYMAKTWPLYYKSAVPRQASTVTGGIRELTGWDFVDTIRDAAVAVLVAFVSRNCDQCDEFAITYKELAAKIQATQRKAEASGNNNPFADLVVARIDQSTNEHTEVVKGTPWLRYWPRGPQKRKANGIDVESRSVEGIWNFLEAQAAAEAEESEDTTPKAKSRGGKGGRVKDSDTCTAHDGSGQCRGGTEQQFATEAPQQTSNSVQEKPSTKIRLDRPEQTAPRGYLSTEEDWPDDV